MEHMKSPSAAWIHIRATAMQGTAMFRLSQAPKSMKAHTAFPSCETVVDGKNEAQKDYLKLACFD